MKRHNDRKLAEIIGDFVHQKPIEKGFWQSKVKSVWEEHMGSSINSYTRQIIFRKGILTVYLDSASLRQELSMNKDQLKRLLNDKIGEARVEEIRLL